MSYIARMFLALALGIAAAGANWMYLRIQTQPSLYVATTGAINQGGVVQESNLKAIPVPGDPDVLRRTLIPYESRAILFGSKATRDFERGDIVFSRDVVEPAAASEWEVIGPFQLISVGERFAKVESQRDTSSNGNTRGNTVTVAVDANFDLQTSRLLSVIAGGRSRSAAREPSIVAVQVVPSRSNRQGEVPIDAQSSQSPASAEFLATSGTSIQTAGSSSVLRSRHSIDRDGPGQTVYQTVSLDGIPNVPAVLLEGDLIRFVIPRNSQSLSADQ